MKGFKKCRNCAKEGIVIPLSKGDNCLICAMCNSSFELTVTEE
jgi:hypothetical protein